MRKIIILLAIAAISFAACEDEKIDNNSTYSITYPHDVSMIDFSILWNPAYYYNHYDMYEQPTLQPVSSWQWKLTELEENEAYLFNSQEDFIQYICADSNYAVIDTPIVNFQLYSLIAVKLNVHLSTGRPNPNAIPIKTMTEIATNEYKMSFQFHKVSGPVIGGNAMYVHAVLVPKLSPSSIIEFSKEDLTN
ncbi:MAG: hypothetical protein LBO06_08845 [Bacteroidales bacterium]|jgi:hypothetical protein|nr:hypothetical protein [Bacteroidales bacterium]